MPSKFIEDQTIENLQSPDELELANYENCSFQSCVLANGDFSNIKFSDCTFKQCDLSMAVLEKTAFQNVTFIDCKLLGIAFEHCNPLLLAMRFEQCQLNFSSFFEQQLKGTLFKDCQLHEVDFSQANLSKAQFVKCDLQDATFDQTVLEQADFSSAFNYRIDPENNRIKRARFAPSGLAGLLKKYDIVVE